MERTLRVAVLGAGAIAREHVPGWRAQPDAEVESVVDIDQERAEEFASAFAIGKWTTDYHSVLHSPNVDVVDICMPPRLHAQATIDALRAGKHVLLEKPFVTTLDEAREVLRAEQGCGATLMVAENWPFASAARGVQNLVDEGALGELFMLRAHHESSFYVEGAGGLDPKLQAATAVGGYTMSAGIHSINLAAHLMGGIETVFAYATDHASSPAPFVERDVVLTTRFGNGGIGSMTFTGRSMHVGERHLAFGLYGTRGTAEFDILRGDVRTTVDGVETTTREQSPSLGFTEEIAHMCACINSGAVPLTSARQQLSTLATVLAVYQSLYERREVRPAEVLASAGLAQTSRQGSP